MRLSRRHAGRRRTRLRGWIGELDGRGLARRARRATSTLATLRLVVGARRVNAPLFCARLCRSTRRSRPLARVHGIHRRCGQADPQAPTHHAAARSCGPCDRVRDGLPVAGLTAKMRTLRCRRSRVSGGASALGRPRNLHQRECDPAGPGERDIDCHVELTPQVNTYWGWNEVHEADAHAAAVEEWTSDPSRCVTPIPDRPSGAAASRTSRPFSSARV